MAPKSPLPLPEGFDNAETYVDSLLDTITSSELVQNLCGGVHILDFLTREPDLYSTLLPASWRDWFHTQEMGHILDLLMRDDLQQFDSSRASDSPGSTDDGGCHANDGGANGAKPSTYHGGPAPPESLLQYIRIIRRHSLNRDRQSTVHSKSASSTGKPTAMSRQVSVGMKPKKIHEVENLARYVDNLTSDVSQSSGVEITHVVDFGSGQNYLGRSLASKPYNKRVVAIESKRHNIDGAKGMDIAARLREKDKVMRNKKEYRSLQVGQDGISDKAGAGFPKIKASSLCREPVEAIASSNSSSQAAVSSNTEGMGSVQYIEHELQNGDLSDVIAQITPIEPTNPALLQTNGHDEHIAMSTQDNEFEELKEVAKRQSHSSLSNSQTSSGVSLRSQPIETANQQSPRLIVVSLHSCGNLLHHGIRSLILNPAVAAVALVGCCYNLVTERLGPPTYKLPTLRTSNPRLDRTSSACDPHGFPISERVATYRHKHGEGVRLNITARMMAVQAPRNWTAVESEAFFIRHFFRTLFQRILVDRGVVSKPSAADENIGGIPRGWTGEDQAIIIGSLRKSCYTSFRAYVRGAIAKLAGDPKRSQDIAEKMKSLTDDEIDDYESINLSKKKELSIVWSLMAFSAGVAESLIVVDRWLFLKEQSEVRDCWVEAVFDYKQSPRNLIVVGIKQ